MRNNGKNDNLVLYLQIWSLSGHKNVELWPKHWPSVSCCQAKVGADELNYSELSTNFSLHAET
jgi:hypothetical protein